MVLVSRSLLDQSNPSLSGTTLGDACWPAGTPLFPLASPSLSELYKGEPFADLVESKIWERDVEWFNGHDALMWISCWLEGGNFWQRGDILMGDHRHSSFGPSTSIAQYARTQGRISLIAEASIAAMEMDMLDVLDVW